MDNIEWLSGDLGEYQDEFLIIDCPGSRLKWVPGYYKLFVGQIELYTHSDIMPKIVRVFQAADYKVCSLYMLESLFLNDISKFFAGVLTATSAMLQLGIPHINIMSKMDLMAKSAGNSDQDSSEDEISDDQHHLHRYLYPDPSLLEELLSKAAPAKFYRLNKALVQLLDEYDMVNFFPVNIKKESSLERIMQQIEFVTQYSENLEPKEPSISSECDGGE